jgi:hypothetical protein
MVVLRRLRRRKTTKKSEFPFPLSGEGGRGDGAKKEDVINQVTATLF